MTKSLTYLFALAGVAIGVFVFTTTGFSRSKPTILSMHKKYDNKLIDIKTGRVVTEIQKDKVAKVQAGIARRRTRAKEPDIIYMKGKKDEQPQKAPAKARKVGGFTILN